MTGAKWVVTAVEKAQYDEMFTRADTDRDGFVNGAEIKNIFLQSGLQQMVLAHIWLVFVMLRLTFSSLIVYMCNFDLVMLLCTCTKKVHN